MIINHHHHIHHKDEISFVSYYLTYQLYKHAFMTHTLYIICILHFIVGVCYIETKSLDGETNLKIRNVVPSLVGKVRELFYYYLYYYFNYYSYNYYHYHTATTTSTTTITLTTTNTTTTNYFN